MLITKKEKYKVTFTDGSFLIVEAISNWDAKEQAKRMTSRVSVYAYPVDKKSRFINNKQ